MYDPHTKFTEKYPDLFDLDGYFIEIAIGEGWDKIVDDALCKLDAEVKKDKELDIHVVQIKEKFGGLRIYTDLSSDEIEKIIHDAEMLADMTCESCGSMENVSRTRRGWIKTLCGKCQKQVKFRK